MWGGKSKRSAARIDTLVGQNTEIVGDLSFSGGLHVDGKVRGNVVATTDPHAIVSISEHGEVEGEVRVPNVLVDGVILGDVFASERLELAPNARVAGNVFYNLIEMAAGAEVNGKLVHQPGGPKLLELRPPATETGTG
ncbi:MAG: polymer-forming cytoskeletal protein [Xanthomonadaceae bacterium]|nr:polymer-forming cytoskeletal protein [Xanthomonadaceae bacterium]